MLSAGEAENAHKDDFTQGFLKNPENIASGQKIWAQRCKFCHGKWTHPDKGPKLAKRIKAKPKRYKPGFIYKRVTYGFRGMPSWKERYSDEERMAVVAYVLSNEFLNL